MEETYSRSPSLEALEDIKAVRELPEDERVYAISRVVEERA